MNLITRNWPIVFLREPGFHTVDSLCCLARPKSMVINGSKKIGRITEVAVRRGATVNSSN